METLGIFHLINIEDYCNILCLWLYMKEQTEDRFVNHLLTLYSGNFARYGNENHLGFLYNSNNIFFERFEGIQVM